MRESRVRQIIREETRRVLRARRVLRESSQPTAMMHIYLGEESDIESHYKEVTLGAARDAGLNPKMTGKDGDEETWELQGTLEEFDKFLSLQRERNDQLTYQGGDLDLEDDIDNLFGRKHRNFLIDDD